MKDSRLAQVHLSPWQRLLFVGLATALSSQLYLSVWAEGFRVSAAAILFPLLLLTLIREGHRPYAGLITGLCVITLRIPLDLLRGAPLGDALVLELPGGLFYFCYDGLLCLLIRDRRTVTIARTWPVLVICIVIFSLNFIGEGLETALNPRGKR